MKTVYAVACYYDANDYPEDTLVLGWNNNYDWYDTDSCVADLFTPKGNLKKIHYGLIDVDRWTSVYVGDKIEAVKEYAEGARSEDIDAKVVKIEIDEDGNVKLTPQE